jgi:hypothetical protein
VMAEGVRNRRSAAPAMDPAQGKLCERV